MEIKETLILHYYEEVPKKCVKNWKKIETDNNESNIFKTYTYI